MLCIMKEEMRNNPPQEPKDDSEEPSPMEVFQKEISLWITDRKSDIVKGNVELMLITPGDLTDEDREAWDLVKNYNRSNVDAIRAYSSKAQKSGNVSRTNFAKIVANKFQGLYLEDQMS